MAVDTENRIYAEGDELKMELQVSNVAVLCQIRLKQIIDSVTVIYHALSEWEGNPDENLPTQSLQVRVYNPHAPSMSLADHLDNTVQWSLLKGLADCISATTEGLVEACRYILLLDYFTFALKPKYESELTKPKTVKKIAQEANLAMRKIEKETLKMSMPDLLKITQSGLTSSIGYIEEIESINVLRNKIVHRFGIMDVDLVLKWIDKRELGVVETEEREITLEDRLNEVRLKSLRWTCNKKEDSRLSYAAIFRVCS